MGVSINVFLACTVVFLSDEETIVLKPRLVLLNPPPTPYSWRMEERIILGESSAPSISLLETFGDRALWFIVYRF